MKSESPHLEDRHSSDEEILPSESLTPEKRKWWEYRLFELNELSKEHIEYARNLFKFLQEKEPDLKAMTIVGSTLKGNAENSYYQKSDIDVRFFLEKGEQDLKLFEHYETLIKEYDKLNPQKKIGDIELLGTVNAKELSNVLKDPSTAFKLIFPGFGNIEELREQARLLLVNLTSEEKEVWIENVVHEICSRDRFYKMTMRGKLSKDDVEHFKLSREKLFRQRVIRIFFQKDN